MKEEREVVDRGRIQFQAEFWLFFFFSKNDGESNMFIDGREGANRREQRE